MHLDRRKFVALSATGLIFPRLAIGRPQTPASLLPSPIIGPEQFRSIQVWKGVRPVRDDTYRLEKDRDYTSKYLIHNYGHGGGGITLSWGCAQRVLDILTQDAAVLPSRKVAVLGSGVIGLTVATVLHEHGYDVTIYCRESWQDTTSAVAGGQFAPSVINNNDRESFSLLVRSSYQEHLRRGASYGVATKYNFTHRRGGDLDMVAAAIGVRPTPLNRLPFRHMNSGGWRYSTLLANPRILLPKLQRDLQSAGVKFVTKNLNPVSVTEIPEPVLINCLGLGASDVWPDPHLKGMKGLLAVLPRQPALSYLYSGIGYLFPRSDHLIVGGSIEEVGTSTAPQSGGPFDMSDLDKARFFLKVLRAVFEGDIPVPEWYSGGDRITDAMMIGRDPDLDAELPPVSSNGP